MKKLAAILFLLVLIFNLYGYRLCIVWMEEKSTLALEEAVDRLEYDDNELISIKTRLDLPYYSSSTEYERVYGSINIYGVEYEYVKRRVFQDTLELLCVPNHAKTTLKSVEMNLAGQAEGQSAPGKSASNFKLTLPDFCPRLEANAILISNCATRKYPVAADVNLLHGYVLPQEKPPRLMQFPV